MELLFLTKKYIFLGKYGLFALSSQAALVTFFIFHHKL